MECINEKAEGQSNRASLDVAKFVQGVPRLRAHRLALVSFQQTPSRVEAHHGMIVLMGTAADQAKYNNAVTIQKQGLMYISPTLSE
jgi:hypothetical protein